MKKLSLYLVAFALLAAPAFAQDGWHSLFDGKTLDGWKFSEKAGSFKVEDGAIVVNGVRSHLFYVGDVNNHSFKNFELKAKVMTFESANSGIYFHTEFQQDGWPSKGFESQINNSMKKEPRMTGSLYQVDDVNTDKLNELGAKDEVWFDYYIKVEGDNVLIKINDKVAINWTQPAGYKGPNGNPGRVLSSGTFAIQAHDPGSKVLVKDIMVKPLK